MTTINIWQHFGDWPSRQQEITAWISRLRPDVVCMQEVADGSGLDNQAVSVAAACQTSGLWYSVAYGAPDYGAHDHAGRPVGLAVLTRQANTWISRFPLPGDLQADPVGRSVLAVRTARMTIYCTHLSPHSHLTELRSKQVKAIMDIITQTGGLRSGRPVILAGDFNAGPESSEMHLLASRYIDCWSPAAGSGHTWSPANPYITDLADPPMRVDYVLLVPAEGTKQARVTKSALAFHEPLTKVYASDHFGVVADIEFEADPASS